MLIALLSGRRIAGKGWGQLMKLLKMSCITLVSACLLAATPDSKPRKQPTPAEKAVLQLEDKNPEVRRNAALFLYNNPAPSHAKVLLKALKDTDPQVRCHAINALTAMRHSTASSQIAKILTNDPEARARQTAAVSIGVMPGDNGAQVLLKALSDTSSGVKIAAIRSLSLLRPNEAVPALTGLLSSDTNPGIRRYTLKALYEIGDSTAALPVAELLNDPDPMIQVEAIKTIEKLDPQIAKERIKALLNTSNNNVKFQAAFSLAKLGDGSAVKTGLQLLNSTEGPVRRQGSEILALAGNESSIISLETAMAVEKDTYTYQTLDFAKSRIMKRLQEKTR